MNRVLKQALIAVAVLGSAFERAGVSSGRRRSSQPASIHLLNTLLKLPPKL